MLFLQNNLKPKKTMKKCFDVCIRISNFTYQKQQTKLKAKR